MNCGALRQSMVDAQIAARGVRDANVLRSMREVPRESFVPAELLAYAYDDGPLPIGEGQTISQPLVVALMAEAAMLGPGDRVLEIGTGSGYAAAVLSRIAGRVWTVDRHASLAREAERRFRDLGYDNISVSVRDGSLGWPEHAPYDAIIVAASGPDVPAPLREQLGPGGRLVIPCGPTLSDQRLIRIRRIDDREEFAEEDLGGVAFVPLIGEAGWSVSPSTAPAAGRPKHAASARGPRGLAERVAVSADPFDDIEEADLEPLVDRIDGCRLVLIGEASHGTAEFYRMRARVSRLLIERGFDFVAIEADWPDAAEIDAWVRHHPSNRPHCRPFERFPRWMWANTDVLAFTRWLRRFNEATDDTGPCPPVGFHGLDLYSMNASMEAVLAYLDDVDPGAAQLARSRYACLTPWREDPILYGRAALDASFERCEKDVIRILNDLLDRRLDHARRGGGRVFDAVRNARLVADAERYYRTMYRGHVSAWNLRDSHMYETLVALLTAYGAQSRGIVWAHNSHLGDASATSMSRRGEHNVGQLVRQGYGDSARLIGFGTHAGTVAAAPDWDEPMRVMRVRPSHGRSYERVAHDSGVARFVLHLRDMEDTVLRRQLEEERLERAIGVIYRPGTELRSHYFGASLPRQFDEWIWFDESHAVTPIGEEHRAQLQEQPDTFPFGV